MIKSACIAAFAAVVLGSASAASAMDDGNMSPSMMAANHMAQMPTMVCRPAATGEQPNAMMTNTDKTAIVCKKIDAAKIMKGPGMMSSADTENEAWIKMMQSVTVIPGFGAF